uniref:Uncharacterized protein n=1 Tax=Vannella robusta TaxID=1487602 RepID=A0A7S4MPQ3_9EUKA
MKNNQLTGLFPNLVTKLQELGCKVDVSGNKLVQDLPNVEEWLCNSLKNDVKTDMKPLWKAIEAFKAGKEAQLALTTGAVPFHLLQPHGWPTILETLKTTKVEKDNTATKAQELKARIAELRAELGAAEDKLASISDTCKSWEAITKEYDSALLLTEKYEEKEIQLAARINEKLQHSAQENEEVNLTADELSLVFNAMGFSQQFIENTAGMTGEDFLSDQNFRFPGISLEDELNACYCKHMLKYKSIPYEQHQTVCEVCMCETSEDLSYLLDEHDLSIDSDLLEKHHINGPRILMLGTPSVQRLFSVQRDRAREICTTLNRLHKKTLPH